MKESVSGDKNVVFLVLDSLRTDRVSVYNEDIDFTDHIQTLADRSVVFENAVAQAPWTLPSHASMFTGEYPWDHGTTHARSYFPEDQQTVISDFKTAGYTTAAITPNIWITPHKGMTGDFDYIENFLGKADNPVSLRLSKLSTKLYDNFGKLTKRVLGRQLDRAFQLFDIDDSCKSEETVDAVEQYLGQREPTENFFLYVNLMEPHEPYHPPQKYVDKHGVTDTSKIPQRQKDMFTKDDVDFDELDNIYNASVDYTDDLVGRIMDALETNNLSEDTVVVLLSDHGQALGERDGLFGHQFTVIEPVINTVLMVDHPDHDAGREETPIEMRKLHDLLPYYAGMESSRPDVSEEIIKGGYEFPENFTGYIPKDEWDDYYRQKRYVKRDGKKVVKSVHEHGEKRYEAYDLETDTEVPVPSDLKAAVDSIGEVSLEDGTSPDNENVAEDNTEVTQRLEALGYR